MACSAHSHTQSMPSFQDPRMANTMRPTPNIPILSAVSANGRALLSECTLLSCAPFLQPRDVAMLASISRGARRQLLQLDVLWSSLLQQRPFELAPKALKDLQQQLRNNDNDNNGNDDKTALWECFRQLSAALAGMQNAPIGSLEAPLQVLGQHAEARGLVLQALQSVAAACESDFHRLVACGKSAHVAVHKVLAALPLDEQVQVAGLRALVLLCRPIGAPEGSIVRRHPSTPWSSSPVLGDVVIDAIKNHANSPQVLCNAAWAASNIALSHKQWAWLAEHHINELLVSVLERFPADERLQLRGLSAFINILRPETDLTRIAKVACAAHEMCNNAGGKVSERAVWVLYIISKWRPHLLRTPRVRQCAIDVLRQDRHLVTFATSLASSVLRHVFNEEPLTLIAQFEASEDESEYVLENDRLPFGPPPRVATLETMAT